MLRSVRASYELIKAQDQDTAITINAIRVWCKQGKVRSLTAGNKILVDIDSLLEYINGGNTNDR